MAGASMKSIKTRIKSVEGTMQITKAMELVASSKLRRAKQQEEAVKPFYRILDDTIDAIVRQTGEENAYLRDHARDDTAPTLYIVIAGDRGLAGGYNNNLFRLVKESLKDGDCILPVGKKSLDYYAKQPYSVITTAFPYAAQVGIPESHDIGALVCDAFLQGRFGHVVVAYTRFVTVLTGEPMMDTLLPLAKAEVQKAPEPPMHREDDAPVERKLFRETVYEPSPEAVLRVIVPQYVSGMVYGAVCEAAASEFAARRQAMNAANKNAGEMIDTLTLKYNRARQAMITQEITEIVAGAGDS